MTAVLRSAVTSGPAKRALRAAVARAEWAPGRLAVLTYHRVDEPRDDGRSDALLSATPEQFAEQVEVLAETTRILSIDEVVDAVAGRAPLPERAVLLTFDDAVEDFRTHALPVLEAHDAPATVFVPTAFVGDDDAVFWWDAAHAAVMGTDARSVHVDGLGELSLGPEDDRAAAYRRLRDHLKSLPHDELAPLVDDLVARLGVTPPPAAVMDWDELGELREAGVACCPHTRTHAHLDRVPIDVARDEIVGSLEDLRAHFDDVPAAFAYPSGQYDEDLVPVLEEAGIEVAFTTRRGINHSASWEPFALRRVNVSRRTGTAAVLAQVLPWAEGLFRRIAPDG